MNVSRYYIALYNDLDGSWKCIGTTWSYSRWGAAIDAEKRFPGGDWVITDDPEGME